MRADARLLTNVLKLIEQWVVPIYQRRYAWEAGEDSQLSELWEELKNQTVGRLDGLPPAPHFFGTIICSESPSDEQPLGALPNRDLVDGQQRIATFQLTLAAIRETARQYDLNDLIERVETFQFNDLSNHTPNPQTERDERFKLWPSMLDCTLYKSIVEKPLDELKTQHREYFFQNGAINKSKAPKLLYAFWYLYEQMLDFVETKKEREGGAKQVIEDGLLNGFLTGFQIVVIKLDQNDDAQKIFASLNGLGEPLTPFDLIRNDIILRAQLVDEDERMRIERMWQEFESDFWSEQVGRGRQKRSHADLLISHALIAEIAQVVNVSKVAIVYKRYARDRAEKSKTVIQELETLRTHAATYRAMYSDTLDEGMNSIVARIAKVLRIWDTSTFHPLVFWVNAQNYDDVVKDRLFWLIESYIVRRSICGLTAKGYNKEVPEIIKHMRERDDRPESGLSEYISKQKSEISRMPADNEMRKAFLHNNAYKDIPSRRLCYILQQIEYKKRTRRDETISLALDNLTIEHVMPQSWKKNWSLPDGTIIPNETKLEAQNLEDRVDDKILELIETRERLINTFGNLTIVTDSLNPSLGNESWSEKSSQLHNSLLVLNREIADKHDWNEQVIQKRSTDLANVATTIWPHSTTDTQIGAPGRN